MKQYKVAKDPAYYCVYRVYKRWFCFWILKGWFTYCSSGSSLEEQARNYLKLLDPIKNEVFFEA